MRYLIFGDVHGNLPALEKLFKLEKDNFDKAISHGDVVNYGPWGNDCVDFLEDKPALVKLRGNHEDNFLKGEYTGTNNVANAFFNFCYPSFSRFNEISAYKENIQIGNYKIQHTVNNKYIFPDSDFKSLELDKNFIIGHSHYQFERCCEGKRLINTGSIGQNRKFLNLAEYVILDEEKDYVELKSFQFDIEHVIGRMVQDGYPKICIDYYRNKQIVI